MKFSVCIPAYNYPELLHRCLTSVLSQDYKQIEIIVADDSEHDQLKDVVYSFNDARIRYFKNDVPKGSPENWNYAVSLASGSIVKVLHHDDWFTSHTAVSKMIHVFKERQDVSFLFCQSIKVFPNGNKKIYKPFERFFSKLSYHPYNLLYLNEIGPPSVVAFRNNLATPLFDIKSKWYVDVIFYVEVLLSGQTFYYLKEPLVNITVGSDLQVTNTTSSVAKVEEAVFTFEKFEFFKKKRLPVRLQLYFIELFKRYKIDNIEHLQKGVSGGAKKKRLALSHTLSKLPIPYQFYALIRRCSLRF